MENEIDNTTNILDEAKKILSSRQKEYGKPKESFKRIASLWGATLGIEVTKEQVAMCMIQLKIARLQSLKGHHDSIVDIIGYAYLLSELNS